MKRIRGKRPQLWLREAKSLKQLSKKVTHLAIGAHSDDLEVIAFDGIVKHFKDKRSNFFGIVVSDNQGKPIHPKYKSSSLSKVQKIREEEQIKAARLGEYAGLAFLRYPSSEIRNPFYEKKIEGKIIELIELLKPLVIYTHNLADKHPTHLAVALRVIDALKKLPKGKRPKKLYGVEVWGGLDWLSDKDKVVFDVSGYELLASKILGVFKSQMFGPHRYDEASLSRRRANAVYHKTHKFSLFLSKVFYLLHLNFLLLNFLQFCFYIFH